MTNASIGTHLMIRVDNKVGTLAEVAHTVSSLGINMIAICAYAVDNIGIIMFVTEDNRRAQKALESKNYEVSEEEVVILTVDNKPGSLQTVTQRVADSGIDLTLVYGSVEIKAKKSQIVLIAENNEAVLTAIKTM